MSPAMTGPAASPLVAAYLADARLARSQHAGMVGQYARAVRRAGREGTQAGESKARVDDLLDELRHHRQRHRVFNLYIWRIGNRVN